MCFEDYCHEQLEKKAKRAQQREEHEKDGMVSHHEQKEKGKEERLSIDTQAFAGGNETPALSSLDWAFHPFEPSEEDGMQEEEEGGTQEEKGKQLEEESGTQKEKEEEEEEREVEEGEIGSMSFITPVSHPPPQSSTHPHHARPPQPTHQVVDYMRIHLEDDPAVLAAAFIAKHDLDPGTAHPPTQLLLHSLTLQFQPTHPSRSTLNRLIHLPTYIQRCKTISLSTSDR